MATSKKKSFYHGRAVWLAEQKVKRENKLPELENARLQQTINVV